MSIETKVAIVTGASQGIGAGIVAGYRKRGWNVVANSRNISQDVYGADSGVAAVAGDVADPQTAARLVETAIERFGRVDTLVNNAGIFIAKPFTDYTAEDFTRKIAVNVAGFFFITQAFIAQLKKLNAKGHVVSITTTIVDQPINGVPAVLASVTKGGIDSATRGLAIEYASSGIRVNAVSPGIIKTPLHAPETHEMLAGLHPVGRMGEIEEIVQAVLYLEDASFVTGETLHVDGGQHAGHW
ncbi:SDR family NAD(P)-dependent oxidoreductase [Sinorhizobium mexicanum]|uniref:SDR family oxidoreductase n=1 Tax=Sinorhizobium mexicanum TaxID=375549 RepID=A0A859QGP9_9HYPH|nr:SDR family oxidoreductase [Sinorhizobium mexicanum]MBP1881847.1 NAD(P)-dependent dehydrogenase (short-subunit alcohol dehydrogenase family) [Sinorhizobium mexicanum]QLL61595.1 SDR family oxidoreductase [Sinorhizobium mexicanum]